MKNTAGYTLIEILVALAIIGILFGTGYANFRDFTKRQVLLDTSKKIQSDLRLAQSMALSGQVPSDNDCRGSNFLHGYFFNVLSVNRYEIRASCSGGVVGEVTKDVTLSPSVRIATPFPVPNPILFKVLGNGTNIGSSNAVISVREVVGGATTTITITNAGQIQ